MDDANGIPFQLQWTHVSQMVKLGLEGFMFESQKDLNLGMEATLLIQQFHCINQATLPGKKKGGFKPIGHVS
jgi:hypothetical protein